MVTWQIKRIYEQPSPTDGLRVLIDRLWPRGISKERAATDMWLKEIAPSPKLRTWFNHEPEKFADFTQKYTDELADNPAVAQLEEFTSDSSTVTLLYAASNSSTNHAVVLRDFLKMRERDSHDQHN